MHTHTYTSNDSFIQKNTISKEKKHRELILHHYVNIQLNKVGIRVHCMGVAPTLYERVVILSREALVALIMSINVFSHLNILVNLCGASEAKLSQNGLT